MKEIPLTQDQFAIVDDWWYEYLVQWKWYARWNPETKSFYAMRNDGKPPNRKSIMMSRVIMNTPHKMECDHKSHNTLDNQESNLRNVTTAQNQMNRRKANANSSTGINGVVKIFKGFRAHISKGGKHLWFPTRNNIEDAIKDRKQAEKEYYGGFMYDE